MPRSKTVNTQNQIIVLESSATEDFATAIYESNLEDADKKYMEKQVQTMGIVSFGKVSAQQKVKQLEKEAMDLKKKYMDEWKRSTEYKRWQALKQVNSSWDEQVHQTSVRIAGFAMHLQERAQHGLYLPPSVQRTMSRVIEACPVKLPEVKHEDKEIKAVVR